MQGLMLYGYLEFRNALAIYFDTYIIIYRLDIILWRIGLGDRINNAAAAKSGLVTVATPVLHTAERDSRLVGIHNSVGHILQYYYNILVVPTHTCAYPWYRVGCHTLKRKHYIIYASAFKRNTWTTMAGDKFNNNIIEYYASWAVRFT